MSSHLHALKKALDSARAQTQTPHKHRGHAFANAAFSHTLAQLTKDDAIACEHRHSHAAAPNNSALALAARIHHFRAIRRTCARARALRALARASRV